ncbi:MAG TPA: ribosome maturation factor RimP [Solirubrobacteraceae bacterium]|jgi:ribosome maturation factor RimP|nr:ribosome maturation factor RimP [Solirubrobacteraceae bacterium]
MNTLQREIEERLASTDPQVEVLLVEVVGGSTLRVFIDHPEGVSLGLCEQVTRQLSDLRATYSLEVSSPGRQRPLTKPAHFRRFVGSRARVRTREPHPSPERGAQPARKSFTGELVGASEDDVTIAADTGVIAIPYAAIHRSHLVEE